MGEDEVNELIIYLDKLKLENSPFLSSIRNFELLKITLKELNSLIEMNEIKNSIVSQIKFLLINDNKNFDGHMLHTVLSGGPGTGKTEVGTILAKIWKALGLINLEDKKTLVVKPINFDKDEINEEDLQDRGKTPKITVTPNNTHYSSEEEMESSLDKINKLEKQIQNLSSGGKIKNNVVKKLQVYINEIKTNLKNIKNEATFNIFQIRSLKREIENNYLLNSLDEIISKYVSIVDEIQYLLSTSIPEETIKFTVTLVNKDIGNVEKELDSLIEEIDKKNKEEKLEKKIEEKKEEEKLEDKDLIRIVSREDFVAGYLGQSALKTEKLLNESIGKVLFIDEAYSLVTDDKDSYGKEVLTTLNRFMSENSSKIVVIFAGYKELLDSTIFTYQPGLRRRCSWFFNIKGYSGNGLSQIFETQLKRNGWKISSEVNLKDFFEKNIKEFPHFGGDTLRLTFYCKICYSKEVFDSNYPNDKTIDGKILNCALEYLKENRIKGNEIDFSFHNMYM